MDSDAKGDFFRLFNYKMNRCLAPGPECKNKAIRAHSIQNSRVIDLLEKNGHVDYIKLSIGANGPFLKFDRIGRNNASTFLGLCGEHDRDIFERLDTAAFDRNNSEQLFLLAWRSVTRELYAIFEAAAKIQGAYQSRIKRGLDDPNQPSPAGLAAVGEMYKAWELWKFRATYYDKLFVNSEWNAIHHDIIEFSDQTPAIAVSSLFSLSKLRRDQDELVRCCLNVFPVTESASFAVFSYVSPDAVPARRALSRILDGIGDLRKYELSKLIIERCENFILAPAHASGWSEDKKDIIEKAFASNIMSDDPVDDHPDLMLF